MDDMPKTLKQMLNSRGFSQFDSEVTMSGWKLLAPEEREYFCWGLMIALSLGELFFKARAFESYKSDKIFRNIMIKISVLSGNGTRNVYIHFAKKNW